MIRFALASLALTLATAQSTERRLGYDRYAGYMPTTQITNVAAIDLDQLIINEQLTDLKLNNAVQVYQNGGNSLSFAKMKILSMNNKAATFPAGTRVVGLNEANETVTGILSNAVSFGGIELDAEVDVKYSTSDSQENYVDCQVGGLYRFGMANRGGCFAPEGSILLVREGDSDAKGTEFSYSYDSRSDNMNFITLQGMSTSSELTMKGPSGEFYKEYQTFVNYYGDNDYGDKWISAAAQKSATSFSSGRGNSDFTSLTTRPGRAEAMKKGMVVLNVWMEVARELNEAISLCDTNVEKAERFVDQAVAYYTGSLTTENDNAGVLLYSLAELRARQFKTAGHKGDKVTGDAFVNVAIFQEFKMIREVMSSQSNAQSDGAGVCQQIQASAERIITLMKVPLIQGVLKYAYERDKAFPDDVIEQEKIEDNAASFAAAVLPFVHECNAGEAHVLHKNTNIGAKTKFSDVKRSLELSYSCMQITCEEIGGIWDSTAQAYMHGAQPCDKFPTKGNSVGAIVGIVSLVLSTLLLVCCFAKCCRNKRAQKQMENTDLPSADNGNILAVGEIA